MLSLGAGSATKTQILQGLGFSLTKTPESSIHQGFQQLVCSLNVSSKDLELKMGNVLFIKKELKPQTSFLDNVQMLYGSKVFSIDFSNPSAAQKSINNYVEKETRGKIVDLIHHLDPLTVMVMVNHIFFKAKWEKSFDPAETSKGTSFLVDKVTTVQVPMMHLVEQFAFGVDLQLNCTVLRMDYSGDAQAFFILPGQGKMGQLEQALSVPRLRKWKHLLQKRLVEIFMPKFSISASYDLGTILPKMGIKDAFNNNADFSGITKKHSLWVSKATHKAMLDISEVGTEAAAVTDTRLTVRSKEKPSQDIPVIAFNKPFMMLITTPDSNNINLIAKIVNTTKS
ncbi:PREDICTED: serpin A9 [Chrysochloris asiatica]|uniref:Serpin A9 n=1 Tax=Chrysochloris asiatica TaxID=185453 RepID=A0A9B0WKW9_CHRAS|nr:PREDICTED: serpin A9 [Chrysochloris asiatica]